MKKSAYILIQVFCSGQSARAVLHVFSLGAFLLCCSAVTLAQKEKKPIRQGNEFYKKQDFNKSAEAYDEALRLAPSNPLANYNMGNAQFRLNKFEDAIERYNNTITGSKDKKETEQAFYNKGVSFSKQHKLDESIAAYKEALKLDPKDQEARENLQKALLEKKQQDQQQQDQNKENKDQKNKKDQDKKDKDKNNQDNKDKGQQKENSQQDENKKDKENDKNPKQQPSKLTKQQVEQLLNAMAQKEKEVREKLLNNEKEKQKKKASGKPEKDW